MFLVGLSRILGRLTGFLGCLVGFWMVWVVFGWFDWIRILERSTFNSGAEQYCSGEETASKAAFLV